MPGVRSGGGYWALLRDNRDFRRLYAATLISLAGDWFLTVALLDLVLELSGSATLASLMVALQTLPAFFAAPFAGHFIDKVDRRKLMVIVDLIRAGAALLPLLTHDMSTLIFAYLGVTIISIGIAWFDPAANAALPNVVTAEQLAPANVLIGSTWGTMLAVGAALGGGVVAAFGRNAAFLVDAGSFVLSALLVLSVRSRFSEERPHDHEHPSMMKAMRETFSFARQNRRVLALLLSKGGFGISGGVVAMLSIFGKEVFAAGAVGIGLLYAARGVGALLGPFIMRAVSGSDDELYRTIIWCGVLFGGGYIALALSHSLLFAFIAVTVAHLGGGAQWQISSYGLQREVPDAIRGRVFSVDYALVTLTMSLSGIASGVLSDRFNPAAATIAVASLAVVWSAVWGVWSWKLWRTNR